MKTATRRTPIAMLTDFGSLDPYVGIMKAVILKQTLMFSLSTYPASAVIAVRNGDAADRYGVHLGDVVQAIHRRQ